MRTGAVISACVLTFTLALGSGRAVAAPLLDVPFVPQSEALCGGAAAAMVLRYWSAAPVYAEDFASLVTESAEGITLGDLTRAIRDRGWRALPFAGTPVDVEGHLARGRPVIALIEDRPGRNHYVVVVAWTARRIVFHDPARGPFQVVDARRFDHAWSVTGRTALLIVPEDDPVSAATSGTAPPNDIAPQACGRTLDRAVALARAGALQEAEVLLNVVTETCPGFSGGPRELAGVRFVQKRWSDAVAFAEEAVARDPSDMHAWQLLATSRYLDDDPAGALLAWNQRAEPRLDLTRIDGLGRTRYEVVAGLVNLTPQTLLTASDIERAARRVAALPVVRASRVSYSPVANGRATVDVAVVERPLVPNTWPSVVAGTLYAATAREARLDIASPTGNGELWTVAARWWAGRPRVALSMATPRLWRSMGLWRVDGSWERQAYSGADGARLESDRRRAAVTFADWTSGTVRWEVSGALDHWIDQSNRASVGAAMERRFLQDQLAVRAEGAAWPKRKTASAFGSGALRASFRSGRDTSAAWTGQAGIHVVGAGAPLDVWPGGDTGHARAPLLRAHPLLSDGVIRAEGLGRVLVHGTMEYQRAVMTRPVGRLSVAAFADLARRGRTLSGTPAPVDLDIGAGLRAFISGAPGALRVDVARGTRDGNLVLTAAWQAAWPGW